MALLSKERVWEFQKLLKEKYGKDLSFAEASESANRLVGFFELLSRVDKKNSKA